MCEVPRGSDRLLTVINNVERTHIHTYTHMQNTLFPPLHNPRSSLLFSAPPTPPHSLILLVLCGALVFCVMSSWGASVFGSRLCLSYEMKKMKKKKRKTARKEDGEGGWKLETPGGISPHIVRICLTASQEGLHLPLNTRGIITDQNKLPICSQQRCLPVKSPELHKI